MPLQIQDYICPCRCGIRSAPADAGLYLPLQIWNYICPWSCRIKSDPAVVGLNPDHEG